MTGRSVVLIGDAAFVARPHTAMGVSKAAGDVMALSNSLESEVDLPSALQRFEDDRIAVGREIVAYGRQLGASAI
jgi:2-polyprenyl-6-methoxyphenol hydroxylase-like FAD-dependent oxidoreductase